MTCFFKVQFLDNSKIYALPLVVKNYVFEIKDFNLKYSSTFTKKNTVIFFYEKRH